ncbi:hypothetical protein D1646_03945 [Pseudoflavonifractor sp. 60]|uniref:hypothetical protein n=1 Tax=Pseudoflavonifractor sp. 60 TaxID=2304576 RepID=UPI00136B4F7C|nr:hypothetical protein [Pseudoflavonifractor sp. 60]NBI65975.1 hypothetical protein [Pseudoflavonifractor sp. 60]
MGKHGQLQRQSRKMALCGMMAALSVVVLTWGSLPPFSTFACPMLAMLCLIPAVCDYGPGTALLMYTAVAVLGLLLCPDKEIALLYTFLGWYPGTQAKVNSLPRFVSLAVKCILFSAAMIIMYSLILYLFRLEAVVEEFAEYSFIMVILMLGLGNLTFLLYDRVFANFSRLYRKKRKL